MLGRSLQRRWILLLVSLILSELKTLKETQESVCRFILCAPEMTTGKKKCFINNGNRYKFDDNMMKIPLDYTSSSTYSVDVLPFKRDINVKKKTLNIWFIFFYEKNALLRSDSSIHRSISGVFTVASGKRTVSACPHPYWIWSLNFFLLILFTCTSTHSASLRYDALGIACERASTNTVAHFNL